MKIKGAMLNALAFGEWRTVNLPGLGVTVKEMLASLERITNKATVDRIQFVPDQAVNKIVSSWPGVIDNSLALQLGFKVDHHFDDFITQFITNYKRQDHYSNRNAP